MTSLLIIRRGADIVAHCDQLCYDAKHDECVCRACGGTNHGIGYEAAVENTRRLATAWDEPGEVQLADAVQNLSLFDLSQE